MNDELSCVYKDNTRCERHFMDDMSGNNLFMTRYRRLSRMMCQ